MEIQHLRAFIAVAEELHFGRAAARLHMAQPPLSRAIKQLERELGAQLFERTTRSVRMTAAGEALVRPAQQVLEDLNVARSIVASAGSGVSGRVRVGFAGASSHRPVARLAREVRHQYPGIDLVFSSLTFAGEGVRQLMDGQLDVAIVRWDQTPPGLRFRPVLKERRLVAVPLDHELAGQDSVTMADLKDEAWVTLSSDPPPYLYNMLMRMALDAGYTPRIAQHAPDSWTTMALVSAGVGIALTFDSVLGSIAAPEVHLLTIAGEDDSVWAYLAWRQDNSNPALLRVLEVSRDALPTPASED
ncbi:LysR family transcriptional regulator [Ornithinimicrobium panacihumi]|uniref:LysR family transcriptional regulator n=1 Tax=Ornithinimicrobium panacihumi TaxID=2008449 RepID=UPI003F88DA1D